MRNQKWWWRCCWKVTEVAEVTKVTEEMVRRTDHIALRKADFAE